MRRNPPPVLLVSGWRFETGTYRTMERNFNQSLATFVPFNVGDHHVHVYIILFIYIYIYIYIYIHVQGGPKVGIQ